jgi:DNA modification methylase
MAKKPRKADQPAIETLNTTEQPKGMSIVSFRLDQLKAYERNPRRNDGAVDRMIGSIEEFGFKIPILVLSDGTVVDGHLRLKAATQLGMTEIPAILCDEWTEAQVKAFRLLANRSAGWAEWDTELLKIEMADLQAADFDLALTGFEALEIENLFKEEVAASSEEVDEEVPQPPADPVTKPGDVWLLGKHRLMCGDSTVITEVEKLLVGAQPSLMVTDPPYGVDYDPKWRDQLDHVARATGEVENDDRADWSDAYSLFTGDVVYVWHADKKSHEVAQHLENCGFEIRGQIIWAKPHFVLSRGHYHSQHEPCWYAVRKNAAAHWSGDRKQSTLWQIANATFQGKGNKDEADVCKTGHGTQKPVECMRRPILNHTERGGAVYEPFCGSGTTIIAAESIGRGCYAMEISPSYVDVAVKRWQEFTGKKATLEHDGRSFDEIAVG